MLTSSLNKLNDKPISYTTEEWNSCTKLIEKTDEKRQGYIVGDRNQPDKEHNKECFILGYLVEIYSVKILKECYGHKNVIHVKDRKSKSLINEETGVNFYGHDPDIRIQTPSGKIIYVHVKSQELNRSIQYGICGAVQTTHLKHLNLLYEKGLLHDHYIMMTTVDLKQQLIYVRMFQKYDHVFEYKLYELPDVVRLQTGKGSKRIIKLKNFLKNGLEPFIDLPE